MQGAVKGLTKLIQGNQQNSETSQIPQYVPQPVQNPVQNYLNTLPQVLKVKALLILLIPKVVELAEVATEVEVVEVEAGVEEV